MDKDLSNIFKEKNKEILITNLKYDLDKNIGSLMETINNMINLEFDTAVDKIIAIFLDANISNSENYVIDTVDSMKFDTFEEIEGLINNKKKELIDGINKMNFKKDEMDKYYETILNSTRNLKEKLSGFIVANLNKASNSFYDRFDNIDDITANRLEDYLKNRLYEKLETKFHMEIMLRDNNLINKAKEGYLRYQEISAKTE